MNGPIQFNEPITLSRECDAVLIPDGTKITIPQDTMVFVTQALGGSVTVNLNGNLARISGSDLDALGMQPQTSPAQEAGSSADGSVDEALIWDQLRTCYDPEIPIDIVELGLIYECKVERIDGGGNHIYIEMTLTAPGCGMGPFLVDDVRQKLLQIPNADDVSVELVFDPPWNPAMMSDAARLQTGLY